MTAAETAATDKGTHETGGKPRMKALCECAHNIMHNATASLLGNHGRDAARLRG